MRPGRVVHAVGRAAKKWRANCGMQPLRGASSTRRRAHVSREKRRVFAPAPWPFEARALSATLIATENRASTPVRGGIESARQGCTGFHRGDATHRSAARACAHDATSAASCCRQGEFSNNGERRSALGQGVKHVAFRAVGRDSPDRRSRRGAIGRRMSPIAQETC